METSWQYSVRDQGSIMALFMSSLSSLFICFCTIKYYYVMRVQVSSSSQTEQTVLLDRLPRFDNISCLYHNEVYRQALSWILKCWRVVVHSCYYLYSQCYLFIFWLLSHWNGRGSGPLLAISAVHFASTWWMGKKHSKQLIFFSYFKQCISTSTEWILYLNVVGLSLSGKDSGLNSSACTQVYPS